MDLKTQSLKEIENFIISADNKEDIALNAISTGRFDVFKLLLDKYIEPNITIANLTIPYSKTDYLSYIFSKGLNSQEIKDDLLEKSLFFENKELIYFLIDSGASIHNVEKIVLDKPDKLHFDRLNKLKAIKEIKIALVEKFHTKLDTDLILKDNIKKKKI